MKILRRIRLRFKKRRTPLQSNARIPQRAPDSGSVFLVALLLVGTALMSNLAYPLSSKAGAGQMRLDAAYHVFSEQAEAPQKMPEQLQACVGSITPLLRTQECTAVEKTAWIWAAPNDLRHAMGEKPCWWYAETHDLAAISGVTDIWAARALDARTQEDGVRLPGELEDVLGAHRTRLIDEAVSINCAMQVRPAH